MTASKRLDAPRPVVTVGCNRVMPAPLNDFALGLLDEPIPCDTCQHAGHCTATGIACRTFAAYVQGEPWEPKSREQDLQTGKQLGLVSDQDIARLRQQLTGE